MKDLVVVVALFLISILSYPPRAAAQNQSGTQTPDPTALAKPGKEHAELKSFVGNWSVQMTAGKKTMGTGTAQASSLLGDRFLVLDGRLSVESKASEFRFTIGFDRRNEEYELTLMDTAGTYSVSARGKRVDNRIRVFGTDNDPFMKKMGIDKKFAFDLELLGKDKFSITTIYVDNRTPEEKLIPAFQYVFLRVQR